MIASANLPRRYPGLKPFERAQSGVFHGREEDIQRLTNLVIRERLVLLFAKSGIGKTSLLQAGVAPELEKQEFVPIFFRSDKTNAPLLDTIKEGLNAHPSVGGHDATGEAAGSTKTLWELLKRLEFDLNGLPATPVLVFDQFEEVFTLTHSEQSRHDFLTELAQLTNETMPEQIRAKIMQQYKQEDGSIDMETMQWWEKQPELRIIISIRSDFLHLVDQISAIIPGILRNRYQLQPLSREKARTAIVRPAMAVGDYCSPVFSYQEQALNQIVDFLAGQSATDNTSKDADDLQSPKQKDEIETVNLQIVCQDIEERIIDWQKPANFEVEPVFYGNIEGLQASIRNFYRNQIEAFPKAYAERLSQKAQYGNVPISDMDKELNAAPPEFLMALAQRLIEESLVTSGNRRNSVVDDTLLDSFEVTPDFLDTLVDRSRLLRKEPRLDDFYYEISHDTLLPAIIESRDTRRQEEKANREKAELEARLAEEAKRREAVEAELKAARQTRKLARTISITLFALLLMMVAFVAWVTYDYIKSVREELRDAEENVHDELFGAALPSYKKLETNPRRRWVVSHIVGKKIKDEIYKTERLKTKCDIIYDTLIRGDFLFFTQKDYAGALRTYHHAMDTLSAYETLNMELATQSDTGRVLRVGRAHMQEKHVMLGQRIESAQQIMITQFKVAQRDFETFSEANVWNIALHHLQKMNKLMPTHPDDIAALQRELNLNESPRQYADRELERCKSLLLKRGVRVE